MNVSLRVVTSALVLALAGAALPARAADLKDAPTVAAALQDAARQHRPVLLDFHAVWCYSCYYMSSHVLNGADWQAVQHKAIVVEVDADSPDGQAWMDKLKVSFLPSYVVLDEGGNELGRIAAEQPRQTFYPHINTILASGNSLDALKLKAQGGAIDAVATVLDAYQARSDGGTGLDWFATLPPSVRKAASGDAHVTTTLDELALAKAVAGNHQAAIVASAQKVLVGDPGCQRPYVLDDLLEASKNLPDAERKALLGPQRQPLDRYLDTQVFTTPPGCADQRSAVLSSANLDAALGDHAGETAVLDRAIGVTRQRLGNNLASDRNLADNLWVYLVRAHRDAEVDAYLPKLIAAYPHDFVYNYRYGRVLLTQGKPAEALSYLAQAYEGSYGENRLRVTSYRVKALKALHRDAEAKQLVAETLNTNGPWFPQAVAALKAQVAS